MLVGIGKAVQGVAVRETVGSMRLCSGQEAELSAQESCLLCIFYSTKAVLETKTRGVGYHCSFSFVSRI